VKAVSDFQMVQGQLLSAIFTIAAVDRGLVLVVEMPRRTRGRTQDRTELIAFGP
jgi:hypothetical protein